MKISIDAAMQGILCLLPRFCLYSVYCMNIYNISDDISFISISFFFLRIDESEKHTIGQF